MVRHIAVAHRRRVVAALSPIGAGTGTETRNRVARRSTPRLARMSPGQCGDPGYVCSTAARAAAGVAPCWTDTSLAADVRRIRWLRSSARPVSSTRVPSGRSGVVGSRPAVEPAVDRRGELAPVAEHEGADCRRPVPHPQMSKLRQSKGQTIPIIFLTSGWAHNRLKMRTKVPRRSPESHFGNPDAHLHTGRGMVRSTFRNRDE
jgi:hypothetical protein